MRADATLPTGDRDRNVLLEMVWRSLFTLVERGGPILPCRRKEMVVALSIPLDDHPFSCYLGHLGGLRCDALQLLPGHAGCCGSGCRHCPWVWWQSNRPSDVRATTAVDRHDRLFWTDASRLRRVSYGHGVLLEVSQSRWGMLSASVLAPRDAIITS